MGSSGKKKTTMAKMARENKLRERRVNKQAKKDARKQAAADGLSEPDAVTPPGIEEPAAGTAADGRAEAQVAEPEDAIGDAGPEANDPRAKEVALTRLRESPDEELAVFADKLLDDARETGATEQELREAQRLHPGHEAG